MHQMVSATIESQHRWGVLAIVVAALSVASCAMFLKLMRRAANA